MYCVLNMLDSITPSRMFWRLRVPLNDMGSRVMGDTRFFLLVSTFITQRRLCQNVALRSVLVA